MSFGAKGQNASEKQDTCIHIDAYIIHSRITKLNAERKENQMCLNIYCGLVFLLEVFSHYRGESWKLTQKQNIIIPDFTLKKKNNQNTSSEMISNCAPRSYGFQVVIPETEPQYTWFQDLQYHPLCYLRLGGRTRETWKHQKCDGTWVRSMYVMTHTYCDATHLSAMQAETVA